MGEPIRIQDMARQMIELCGFVPDEDIKISFTGLRPGEKLFEEPIHIGENIKKTTHPMIYRLVNGMNADHILPDLTDLKDGTLYNSSTGDLKEWLATRIPEYRIWRD